MQTRVPFDKLKDAFVAALLKAGLSKDRAKLCGRLFAENQRDGVYSHGLNRFPGLLAKLSEGRLDGTAEPECVKALGVVEQWDGKMGVGLVNAHLAMGRAIEIAKANSMGCIGLRNTNHWMRAGAYGLQAADAGCIGMCWTNTTPLMPPWGATEKRIGNNPMTMAIPRKEGHILLDMAMSQYSNGKLEVLQARGETLPIAGGFDTEGNLTCDPGAILDSQRALPIGYWKGSALAIVLDTLAALLSAGQTTHDIGAQGDEHAVSQTYIAIDVTSLNGREMCERILNGIIDDLHGVHESARYPGEGMLRIRRESEEKGVLVDEDQWEELLRIITD